MQAPVPPRTSQKLSTAGMTATTPLTVENSSIVPTEMIFPHLADGGGFTTQFILFSATAAQFSSGNLLFYTPNGQLLSLPLRPPKSGLHASMSAFARIRWIKEGVKRRYNTPMGSTIRFVEQHWNTLLLPLSVMAVTLLIGLVVRNVVFRTLRRWAAGTKSKLDDIVVEALRSPFMIWVLMLALHFGAQTSRLPVRAQNTTAQFLLILFIISMTLVSSRLAGVLIQLSAGPISSTSLTGNVVRIVLVLLGVMIVLNTLGISILPILTALGVGGIAIALALQDTLSNLFSGFYVSMAGQVRIGDYIKLDSGEEGYITDISWRSTSIRSLQNNAVIIPNAKLAKATITNYNLPEQSMAVSVAVSVSYDCDPQAVENVLLDEARKAAEQVPGLLSAPAPIVRFMPGFGPSSLDLTLICHVRKFADQYLVQHELRKRIVRRFREAQIEIPFPTRTIYMHDQSSKT